MKKVLSLLVLTPFLNGCFGYYTNSICSDSAEDSVLTSKKVSITKTISGKEVFVGMEPTEQTNRYSVSYFTREEDRYTKIEDEGEIPEEARWLTKLNACVIKIGGNEYIELNLPLITESELANLSEDEGFAYMNGQFTSNRLGRQNLYFLTEITEDGIKQRLMPFEKMRALREQVTMAHSWKSSEGDLKVFGYFVPFVSTPGPSPTGFVVDNSSLSIPQLLELMSDNRRSGL